MNRFPDFFTQGYQVISELGRNREGGRITWLASDITTGRQVVLKQFCFAQAGSSWSGFNAYQREIQILQALNHPGIPRYLGAFATSDGFCMIQEYINAPSLAVPRRFEPEEIKQIAVSALQILVYLQNQIPPVIHRDIKPENILVDEQLKVYLIDFGFARLGSQEVSGSSVFKGTPGFIPPEQLRMPTEASDLYSLGTTLICLLTGTASHAILDLTDKDDPYLIHFRHLLPRLSLRFLDWLELMVQPSLKRRFSNARMALEALNPIDLIRLPGVEFSEAVLNFQAKNLGEKLTQTITVENVIPETLLEGRWDVAPHPHDPPHTPNSHAWICVTPTKFAGNKTLCRIQVDTSKLMADKLYKRQLLLHSNAYPEIHPLTVKVQTAPLPIERKKLPYVGLAKVFLTYAISPKVITWFTAWAIATLEPFLFWFSVFICLSICMRASVDFFFLFKKMSLSTPLAEVRAVVKALHIKVFMAVFYGMFMVYYFCVFQRVNTILNSVIKEAGISRFLIGTLLVLTISWAGYTLLMAVCGAYVQAVWWIAALDMWEKDDLFTELLWLFTAGVGTSLGVGWVVGFFHPYILLALTGTGIPLATMLFYPPLKQHRLIAKYRKSEQRLIKP
jgi:serine/threonine protein kinase